MIIMIPKNEFAKLLAGALGKGKIYGEEFFSPKQKDLFPELRRELTLEMEDKAKSDDPLEACLERRGYKKNQINEYQEKIAEKQTPDMFGKQEKLTGKEVMFQETLANCLESMKQRPKGLFGLNGFEKGDNKRILICQY